MARHLYDSNELVDMLMIYGESDQVGAEASRLYAERFPTRFHPSPTRFMYLVQRARDTGQLLEQRGVNSGRVRSRRMLKTEEDILDIVENDSTLSIRDIAREMDVSQFKVYKTLAENELYTFHVLRVQALLPQDYPQRVKFCQWLLQKNSDKDFTRHILFTDEVMFTQNGINNVKNTYKWTLEGRQAIRETDSEQFEINVWAGIVDGRLIGPFILPDKLTSLVYLNFLQNDLPELLENVPLNVRQNMWFLHAGDAPYFRRDVLNYLNNIFAYTWIGRRGPVSWPLRSFDLHPCYFYLWAHMRTLVYATEVDTIEELRVRIENAAETIRGQDAAQRCTESWIRRARLCVENNGANFEYFL